jgi:hypothetical protein
VVTDTPIPSLTPTLYPSPTNTPIPPTATSTLYPSPTATPTVTPTSTLVSDIPPGP